MGERCVFDLTGLTPKEVAIIHRKVEFTAEQMEVLEYLRKGELNDDGIMLRMCINRNKYYIIKHKVFDKILKAAAQS